MDTIEERYISNAQGDWRIRLVPDSDAKPFDADCYSAEDIEAWRKDEWSYVGVIVTDSKTGADAFLWAVEYGLMPEATIGINQIIEEYFDDLRAEVLAQLAERAAELTAQ